MRLPELIELSPAQQALEERMARRRGRLEVYRALLHHPALAGRVSELGEAIRFEGVLPEALRELATLRVAWRLGCGYEWALHRELGARAGLPVEAWEGGDWGGLEPTQQRVVEAVDLALERVDLPGPLQRALADEVGHEGVLELVVLAGFYALLAGVIGCFQVPAPPGSPWLPEAGAGRSRLPVGEVKANAAVGPWAAPAPGGSHS